MRCPIVCGLAVLVGTQQACTSSHDADAATRMDAWVSRDALAVDDVPADDTDAYGSLAPCSVRTFDTLGTESVFVDVELCWDPLEDNRLNPSLVMADGLVWYAMDTFVPLSVENDGDTVLLDGLLAHRPDEAIPRECDIGVDCPPSYLLGFHVRYRIRFDGAAPFAALEEARVVDPEVVVAELRAASEETDCETVLGSRSGRLVCASSGRWDVWSHAARAPYPDGETDPETIRRMPRWREPTVVAVALIDREAREVWWLGLQGLPDDCEHPRDMPYDTPCRPVLQPSGAHTMFAVPGTAHCDGSCRSSGGIAYCPLELSCVTCCPPATGIGEYYACRDRGFCQSAVDSSWLEAACAAERLEDVPAAPSVPCPEGRFAGCPMDTEDGPCP